MSQRNSAQTEDLLTSMAQKGPKANGYQVCSAERVNRLTGGDPPDTDLDYRHVILENGLKGIVRYWRGAFYLKAL